MFNRIQGQSSFQEDPSFLIPDHQIDRMPLELRELCEMYNAECSEEGDESAGLSDWPVSLFVPEPYEENYAYPLVIWFHDEGSSENELNPVMSAIGEQNYCGLALRGNRVLEGHDCFGWNLDGEQFGSTSLTSVVNVTARRLRRAFHIHSERIFAAGSGTGADIALGLFALNPQWFAGAVLIDPHCSSELTLGSVDDIRGKPVLQMVSRTASNQTLAQNLDSVRLLRSAGAEIEVRVTEEPLDPCSNNARFLDNWLMSKLNCVTYV